MMSTSVLRPGVAVINRPNFAPDFADVDAKTTTALVVSDSGNNTVVALSATGKTTATISSGISEPQGLSGDTSGNLYIANTANSDILVYKNDYKTLLTTLTDPGQYPVGVDISVTSGIVGVTNIISTAGGAGSVSFYGVGKTTPCKTVSSSTFARVYFGAFDAHGNFFVDGEDSNGSVVVGEVTGACKATTITTLTTKNAITFPGGIQVSPTGSIVIDDQSGAAVYTYAPPVKGSLGAPTATTPLSGASDPVSFALVSGAKSLYTADAGLAEALTYAYPKGGSPTATFSGFTQPIGVTAVPVEKP